MLKKFILGYAMGLGIMHYYLTQWNQDVDDVSTWGNEAASNYRNDKAHQVADEILKDSKGPAKAP